MRHKRGLGRRQGSGAFTLVEIMVVVVIIGLLATMVAPRVMDALFRSNIKKAKVDIRQIAQAVQMFQLRNNGRLPDDLEALVTPDENGQTYLQDLTEVPLDPWGNEYRLEPDPEHPRQFIVRSYGEDGQPETEDDITNKTLQKEMRGER